MCNLAVTIVLSMYKPQLDWFAEQLQSLNNQTYKNLDLIIWNDYPEDKIDYSSFFIKYLTKIKFKYFKGTKNLGVMGAFEKLSLLATGDLIAYCDQDDIWLENKISILVEKITSSNIDLICSNVYVMDKYGAILSDSISKIRPMQKFVDNKDLFKHIAMHGAMLGCTMLAKREFVNSIVPFPKDLIEEYHDWWLSLNASYAHKLLFLDIPLIKYRIHGENQSGLFSRIATKEDYRIKRTKAFFDRANLLKNKFSNGIYCDFILTTYNFATARLHYSKEVSLINSINLLKYISINPKAVLFEFLLPYMPEKIFSIIIKELKC